MARRAQRALQAKPPSQRQLRVGEALRHALAELLGRGAFRERALREASITVTEVRVGPDLKHATAFVTPLGGGDAGEILEALRRATPYLRAQVARLVPLKFTPDLVFEADTSFDRAARIDALLRALEEGSEPSEESDSEEGPKR